MYMMISIKFSKYYHLLHKLVNVCMCVCACQAMISLPLQPALITVCANNILHKWNLVDDEGVARLVHGRTYKFQGGL